MKSDFTLVDPKALQNGDPMYGYPLVTTYRVDNPKWGVALSDPKRRKLAQKWLAETLNVKHVQFLKNEWGKWYFQIPS